MTGVHSSPLGAPPRRDRTRCLDEALAAGLGGSDPVVIPAKMLRLELLKVKGDLEQKLSELVLDCTACGMEVHWVSGGHCCVG